MSRGLEGLKKFGQRSLKVIKKAIILKIYWKCMKPVHILVYRKNPTRNLAEIRRHSHAGHSHVGHSHAGHGHAGHNHAGYNHAGHSH